MKCGRELQDQKVFCTACLEDMENYPVKPGTLILLPQQQTAPAVKKKPAKRPLKPEEQLARTRSSMRLLVIALCVTLAAFALTVLMLLHFLDQRDSEPPAETTGYHTENRSVSRETDPNL